jgi:hypothetical protein
LPNMNRASSETGELAILIHDELSTQN